MIVGLAIAAGMVHSHGSAGGMERYDWSQLPSNLLLTQAWGLSDALTFNYVSWSLSAEWLCYLLLPVIALAARKGGAFGLFALLAVVIVLLELSVAIEFMPYTSWMKASTWGAYRAFADFIVGAIAAKLAMESRWTLASPFPAWGVMLAACAAMQLGWPKYLIFAMLGFALLLAAVSERNAPERSAWLDVFAPIANVSFGIYLWHPVLEAILLSFVWRKVVEPSGMIGFYWYLILPMALTVIVALLSFKYAERPANSWILSRAGFKRENRAPALAAGE